MQKGPYAFLYSIRDPEHYLNDSRILHLAPQTILYLHFYILTFSYRAEYAVGNPSTDQGWLVGGGTIVGRHGEVRGPRQDLGLMTAHAEAGHSMAATRDHGKGGGALADKDGGAARGASAWYTVGHYG